MNQSWMGGSNSFPWELLTPHKNSIGVEPAKDQVPHKAERSRSESLQHPEVDRSRVRKEIKN